MIKVYQDKFSKLDGSSTGNCLAACMASLFEVKTSELPDFIKAQENGGSWFKLFIVVAARYNYVIEIVDPSITPDGYSISTGPSTRGPWCHACIYYKGQLFHDPHPEGTGLPTVTQQFVLTKRTNE